MESSRNLNTLDHTITVESSSASDSENDVITIDDEELITSRKGRNWQGKRKKSSVRKNVLRIPESLLFDDLVLNSLQLESKGISSITEHFINRFDYTWVFLRMFLPQLESMGYDCKDLVTSRKIDNISIVKPATSVTGNSGLGTEAAHMISVKLNKNFIIKINSDNFTNEAREDNRREDGRKQSIFDIIFAILSTAEIMPKIVNRSFDTIIDDATSEVMIPATSFKDYKNIVKKELDKIEDYLKALKTAYAIIQNYGDEETCPDKYININDKLLDVFFKSLDEIKKRSSHN